MAGDDRGNGAGPGDPVRASDGRRASMLPSAVFVGLVGLVVAAGVLTWNGTGPVRLWVFGFVVAGWVVSLCLHEYAHALLAYLGGDRSVVDRGYLTLNPLRYAHPALSIVLPVAFLLLGGIGLPGGAVWLDRHAVPGRLRRTLISLAGPATNALFGLVLGAVFLVVAAGGAGGFGGGHPAFWAALAFLGFLQVTAALLNALPVPGVDGGNAVEPWLNDRWRRGFTLVAPYGMLLLFAMLALPQVNGVFFAGVDAIGEMVGIPRGLVAEGYQLFRFWA